VVEIQVVAVGIRTVLELFCFSTNYTDYTNLSERERGRE
jgi:hypothetical protein